MKFDHRIDDGDLQYIASVVREVIACVDRLTNTVSRVLNMRTVGAIQLFGRTFLTWEATVHEAKNQGKD